MIEPIINRLNQIASNLYTLRDQLRKVFDQIEGSRDTPSPVTRLGGDKPHSPTTILEALNTLEEALSTLGDEMNRLHRDTPPETANPVRRY